jgi:hypothetical protein
MTMSLIARNTTAQGREGEQRLARQQWRERTDESATSSDDDASGDIALGDATEE